MIYLLPFLSYLSFSDASLSIRQSNSDTMTSTAPEAIASLSSKRLIHMTDLVITVISLCIMWINGIRNVVLIVKFMLFQNLVQMPDPYGFNQPASYPPPPMVTSSLPYPVHPPTVRICLMSLDLILLMFVTNIGEQRVYIDLNVAVHTS